MPRVAASGVALTRSLPEIGRAHVLNSSPTEIYTLSLHDALPISADCNGIVRKCLARLPTSADASRGRVRRRADPVLARDRKSTRPELQSHRDLHSFPTRRSSDLGGL